MTVADDHVAAEPARPTRADRTRASILDASRRLFLERGYAGTTVNAITEECGISRAGFYTYFKDKRDVFGLLGNRAYRDLRAVLATWDTFTAPRRIEDVRAFVRDYFAYMDRHGAFAMAAAFSAPDDAEFRRGNTRMQTRIAWILGQAVAPAGAHSPEVVGTAAFGLLDRCWHTARTQTVAVDEAEMIEVAADALFRMYAKP
ncbi:TetR/AcrR family transcriptional regulator [Nocardia bovistercoris]|uniref:TetR/AcrR family transcriptional regulator n=1 Tax=Nocardia bovistercoris TaxID=2785916 RepID=A0A931N179_9NOCA|nr:TetR/AcrR family transcriptional regulator [Nocardia bovistercoris]